MYRIRLQYKFIPPSFFTKDLKNKNAHFDEELFNTMIRHKEF